MTMLEMQYMGGKENQNSFIDTKISRVIRVTSRDGITVTSGMNIKFATLIRDKTHREPAKSRLSECI